MIKTAVFLTLSTSLVSCVILKPRLNPAKGGKLTGEVFLKWNNTQEFVYFPNVNKPLSYTFPKKYRISSDEAINNDLSLRTIRPKRMYTDSGSIPRPVWGIPGLSPYDYLPAYVVHDWLYHQKHCFDLGMGDYTKFSQFPYSLEVADEALYDALDALDINLKGKMRPANAKAAKKLIRAAVSKFGGIYWNAKTKCKTPLPERAATFERAGVQAARRTRGRYITIDRFSAD